MRSKDMKNAAVSLVATLLTTSSYGWPDGNPHESVAEVFTQVEFCVSGATVSQCSATAEADASWTARPITALCANGTWMSSHCATSSTGTLLAGAPSGGDPWPSSGSCGHSYKCWTSASNCYFQCDSASTACSSEDANIRTSWSIVRVNAGSGGGAGCNRDSSGYYNGLGSGFLTTLQAYELAVKPADRTQSQCGQVLDKYRKGDVKASTHVVWDLSRTNSQEPSGEVSFVIHMRGFAEGGLGYGSQEASVCQGSTYSTSAGRAARLRIKLYRAGSESTTVVRYMVSLSANAGARITYLPSGLVSSQSALVGVSDGGVVDGVTYNPVGAQLTCRPNLSMNICECPDLVSDEDPVRDTGAIYNSAGLDGPCGPSVKLVVALPFADGATQASWVMDIEDESGFDMMDLDVAKKNCDESENTACCSFPCPSSKTTRPYELTRNGITSLSDYIALMNSIGGNVGDPCVVSQADLDGDGVIEADEVQRLYCHLMIADFNEDGFPDGFDYDEFVEAFENGECGADVTLDLFLDGFDYDAFVEAFENNSSCWTGSGLSCGS